MQGNQFEILHKFFVYAFAPNTQNWHPQFKHVLYCIELKFVICLNAQMHIQPYLLLNVAVAETNPMLYTTVAKSLVVSGRMISVFVSIL